jgi:hypothetical protein
VGEYEGECGIDDLRGEHLPLDGAEHGEGGPTLGHGERVAMIRFVA